MKKIQLFNKVIMGAWVLLEKHEKGCECSYCRDAREVNKKMRIVLPECKAGNAWRYISYRTNDQSYTYLRSTLPQLSYFLGFDYSSWSTGFRLKILPAPITYTNSLKAFLTITNSRAHRTRIKGIESFLWQNMIVYSNHDGNNVGSQSR